MSLSTSISRIQQLETSVINKIAAGEVIERPASAVKELLENSIDALSTRISVEIEDGGAELIRIVDDGEGILPEDLPLAVSSHATSKLSSPDDLFRVKTLGFRGEALASIAEVSHFSIKSRPHEAEIGYELAVQAGAVQPIKPCGMAPGTQIEVRQLFCNTPVRRKFLKKPATEFGQINEQFTRLALANPRLQLSLKHQGKKVHELPATLDLEERLRSFYGEDFAKQLIPIEQEAHGVRLWGYVGAPSLHKGTRKSQYLFLNGRYIQDRSILHAVNEAYRGLIMVGRHPVCFLFLEMPADQVDVNVHPTKIEVRFRDSSQLFRLVLSTLRRQFLESEFSQALSVPKKQEVTTERQQEVERDLASWAKSQLEMRRPTEAPPASPAPQTPSPQWAPPPTEQPQSNKPDVAEFRPFEDLDGPSIPSVPLENRTPLSPDTPETELASETPSFPPAPTNHASDATATPEHREPSASGVPALQIDETYVVIATDQGLTVIDQHALHERVMYERFRNRVLGGTVEKQKLLMPLTLEMQAAEVDALIGHTELVQEMGFEIEAFGGSTILVSAYPTFMPKGTLEEVVHNLAERLENQQGRTNRLELLDELLQMMACKAAIKGGDSLTTEEILALLAERDQVEDAHHCPHGRPTALVLSREDLDKQFGRLGAG